MQCCHARSTTPSPVDVAVPQTHRKPKATISVSSGCFQHGEVCARATLRGSLSACLPVCLLKKLRRGVEVRLGTEEVIRCQDNTQAPGPRPRPQKARTLRILLPASSEIPLTTWALHSGTFLCSVGRGLLHCTPFDHHRMFIESLFPATWLQLALCVCSLSDLISWQSARPSDPASVQNKAPSSSNLTEPHADHRSPIGGRLMGTHTSAS